MRTSFALRAACALALCLSVLSLSPRVHADETLPGFDLSTLAYPGLSATASLQSGEVVAFDGDTVSLYTEGGALIETLYTFPSGVFPSFVLVNEDETEIVFGESSNGDIFRADLELGLVAHVTRLGGQPLLRELRPADLAEALGGSLANLNFNFAAAYEDATHVIVSAAVCGFCGVNEVHRVDLGSGTTTLLAEVAGASGPVAVAANGDLFYGTVSSVFPPPAGGSDVLRWSAAQLTGAPVLTEADATVVAAGFENATSLAYDPDWDRLYLSENDFLSGSNVVRRVGVSPATSPVLVTGTTFQTINNLQFLRGDGVASFVPYQPVTGGRLHYNSTDFFSTFARREVSPSRPIPFFTGVGLGGPGPFDLHLTNGAPNGTAFVLFSATHAGGELPIYLPARGFFLFLGLDLLTLDGDPVPFSLDSDGCGTNAYINPGGLEGSLTVQVLVLDDLATIVGISSPADN